MDTHPVSRDDDLEQAMLGDVDDDNAHDPTHQTRLPRLLLGVISVVPLVSLVLALTSEGATRAAVGYFHILWTALLVLIYGGWMLKTERFSTDRKLAWVFGFILAAPLSLPLYWYMNVWQAPTARVAHA